MPLMNLSVLNPGGGPAAAELILTWSLMMHLQNLSLSLCSQESCGRSSKIYPLPVHIHTTRPGPVAPFTTGMPVCMAVNQMLWRLLALWHATHLNMHSRVHEDALISFISVLIYIKLWTKPTTAPFNVILPDSAHQPIFKAVMMMETLWICNFFPL